MPLSQTDIVNLALSHICEKTVISMTEKSIEAETATQFWQTALNEVLRDFSWPFATKYDNLSLVPMNPPSTSILTTTPNQNWAYAYNYPSDCLYFRRVLSGAHQDSQRSRVPYIIAKSNFINPPPPLGTTSTLPTYTSPGGAGLFVFTNQQFAQCEYTFNVDDTSTMPPDFIMALSLRLAAYMAPRLTGGDPFKLKQECLALYDMEITKAKANSFNEENQPQEMGSEFSRFRDSTFYDDLARPGWFPAKSGFLID